MTTRRWRENLENAIFELSVEKKDFIEATNEWWIAEVKDLYECVGVCHCTKTGIRFCHNIINSKNGTKTWVGSECINQFGRLAPIAELCEVFFHEIRATYDCDDYHGHHIFIVSSNLKFFKNRHILAQEYGSIPIDSGYDSLLLELSKVSCVS